MFKFRYNFILGRRAIMYYVLQVSPGEEIKIERLIINIISTDIYGECFHLLRHVRKKFRGKWVDIYEKLLPGYIFITSDNIEKLYVALKKIPIFINLLGKECGIFVALSVQEVEWIHAILGESINFNDKKELMDKNKCGKWHEVAISQISISNKNKIKIVSGPLKNIEDKITKFYLHKRIAELEVELMKQKITIYMGIELVGDMDEEKKVYN